MAGVCLLALLAVPSAGRAASPAAVVCGVKASATLVNPTEGENGLGVGPVSVGAESVGSSVVLGAVGMCAAVPGVDLPSGGGKPSVAATGMRGGVLSCVLINSAASDPVWSVAVPLQPGAVAAPAGTAACGRQFALSTTVAPTGNLDASLAPGLYTLVCSVQADFSVTDLASGSPAPDVYPQPAEDQVEFTVQ
jgi:hypothetical protein